MINWQVVFASTSEGRDWRWRGVVANPADYPESVKGTTSELAIAEAAALVAIMRLDGDCACDEGNYNECGFYKNYYRAISTDRGYSWSVGQPVSGIGCVKPNLLRLGSAATSSPLLLTGGRFCTAKTSDLFLWFDGSGRAKGWANHSLSYVHNSLWRGDKAYKYDGRINSSAPYLSQNQDYTSLLRISDTDALITYNKYFHPGDAVPGCSGHEVCSSAFAMRVSVERVRPE